MKKVLSFVLVLSMVLGSVSMAFANTENAVTKVPTVAAETGLPTVKLALVVKDAAGLTGPQQIKLTLENGTWGEDVDTDDLASTVTSASITTANAVAVHYGAATPVTTANAISVGDNYVEFEFEHAGVALNDYITLELNIFAGDEEGEVKVKVDGLDSQISSGVYTVAVVGTDNTVATVNGDPTLTGRTDKVKGAVIEIRESAVNSIRGAQQLKITLPKGYEWVTGAGNTAIGGNLVDTTKTVTVSAVAGSRDLNVEFTAAGTSDVREVLTLTPYIKVTKDAKLGDVSVQIRNQLSGDYKIDDEAGLVIANYCEEGVTVSTVKEADLPEMFAGRLMEDLDRGSYYEVKVTLTELQDKSLIPGKYVDFEFPEYVQIVSGQAITVETNITGFSNASAAALCTPAVGTGAEDDNTFEWYVPTQAEDGKANKVTFTIPVTVESCTPSGDLEVVVSGAKAGIDETKLVVGKIIAPITAEVKVSDVKTGVQKQTVADIIIKEAVAGAIVEGGTLEVALINNNQDMIFNKAYAEVVAGDLELTKAEDRNVAKAGRLVINIERSSIKTPAEIKISNVVVTLDRTPAEGKYEIGIGGTSLVNNTDHRTLNNGVGFDDAVVYADYLNVVTPADQGVNATFKIGESKYTVNGVEVAMDAPSYVDDNNRTMVSIRYIANALGVSDNAIIWNEAAQTATIFGKSTVVVTIGEDHITVNGSVVPMDTQAVNKAGRIYVPLRYIANALGAAVEWNQEAQTATIITLANN